MSRVFALVDCNNCYVSCERIFDPTLRPPRHRPLQQTVVGARLVMELRGVSRQPLETAPPAK